MNFLLPVIAFILGAAIVAFLNPGGMQVANDMRNDLSRIQANELAAQIASQTGWQLRSMNPNSNSMGSTLSRHSFSLVAYSWETVSVDKIVVMQVSGRSLIHRVVAGNHKKGFRTAGDANPKSDITILTRENYIATLQLSIPYDKNR